MGLKNTLADMITFHKESANKSNVLSWQTDWRNSSSSASLENRDFLALEKLDFWSFVQRSLQRHYLFSNTYLKQEPVPSRQELMEIFSRKGS